MTSSPGSRLPRSAKLITVHQVSERTGLTRQDIHNRVKRGTFPEAKIKLPRNHLWDPQEVDRWIAADIAQRAREL
jgi:predicted DNA-binding transcriptional regulator AlpA